MAERKSLTNKKTPQSEVSSLVKALQKLQPTKRPYTELSKSGSSTSVSSWSSASSGPYVTMSMTSGPPPCPLTSRGSGEKEAASEKENKTKKQKEQELLRQLQKSVQTTAKTLDKYIAERNRKK